MIVTLSDAKAYLRVETSDENDLITSLIETAQAAAEDYCRVDFEEDYDTVPQPVKLAVMLMVSHYYENRDVYDGQTYLAMETAFKSLLYPYRDVEQML